MQLDNLKNRIKFQGGASQKDRMIQDKINGLNKALLYSYQSATAVLEDGREFRCLINPNKINMEIDDKMLSIQYEDVCLNKGTSMKEPVGVKCGSVIEWKENKTRWIVYSQYLQEVAYFRGLMRQCENEPLEIGGKKFWYYLKGPDEKSIEWQKTKHFIVNELNYSLEIYISNTTETKQFFQRFKKCKIKGRNFEVQTIDDLSTEGILTVYLKEDYNNEWEKAEDIPPVAPSNGITGPVEVYPYDTVKYSIKGVVGGTWALSNSRAKILQQDESSVTIEITTGKSGSFSLIYKADGMDDIVTNIKILSL